MAKDPLKDVLKSVGQDQQRIVDKFSDKAMPEKRVSKRSPRKIFGIATALLIPAGLVFSHQMGFLDTASPAQITDNRQKNNQPFRPQNTQPPRQSEGSSTPVRPRATVPPVMPRVSFNHVTTTNLNVRRGPGTNHEIVGILEAGSCLKALQPSSRSGWMTFNMTIIDGRSAGTSGLPVHLSQNYVRETTRPDSRCSANIRLMPKYNYLGR